MMTSHKYRPLASIISRLRRFKYYTRQSPSGLIHEILVRRVAGPLTLFLEVRSLHKYPLLTDLIVELNELATSFLLIVLLSCRFDVFEQYYYKYLKGVLTPALAPQSYSIIWIPRLFSIMRNVKVFMPILRVGVHDTSRLAREILRQSRSVNEVVTIGPDLVINYMQTTSPSHVNNTVFKEGLTGRDIIFYIQPHFPWIMDRDLSITLKPYIAVHELIPGDIVGSALKKHNISRERLFKAYSKDLILILNNVSKVIKRAIRLAPYEKVIVTAIHGELFGEFGLYFHKDLPLHYVTLVPWLEVKL